MAYGTLAAPGTQWGPCAESCAHIDCRLTKAMAESPCTYCKDHIGYDTPFLNDNDAPKVHVEGLGNYPAMIHQRCYWKREGI